MYGRNLFKAGESSQNRSGSFFCSEAWKDNHMYFLKLYFFPRKKHLKMMDHSLMSVDREGRESYTSDHPRAGELGKCQLSLNLHRSHSFGRWEKATAERAEMRTFLPSLPLESYHPGQLASSWAVSLHNWPIRHGKFLTISPSYALHEWAITEWMVGLL